MGRGRGVSLPEVVFTDRDERQKGVSGRGNFATVCRMCLFRKTGGMTFHFANYSETRWNAQSIRSCN